MNYLFKQLAQLVRKMKPSEAAVPVLDVAMLEPRVLFSASPIDPGLDLADPDITEMGEFEDAVTGSLDWVADWGSPTTAVPPDAEFDSPLLLASFDPMFLPAQAGEHDGEPDHRHLDAFGNEYHILTDLPVTAVDGTDAPEAATAGAPTIDLSQTFFLHSNPGASHTIYLDFNGHTTSGTSWNTSFNGGEAFYTPEYDFDGLNGFSDAELERIQHIWQRVAEDFIPFDVNVTTEELAMAGLANSGGGDSEWGVRVVIGGSSGDWFGTSAGGVAYVGSFDWSNDTPAYVFEAQLGNGHEKYTAEAISHEIGHTLSLSHDGTSTSSYYSGQGSGDTGWAPIMGVGYYKELSQWSRGEYADANNTQDDLAIITSNNGFGYRADDHGDTNSQASQLALNGSIVSDAGIVEQNTDFDVFTFVTDGGLVDLDINPFVRGPNLDILAELYDSANNLIAASNPLNMLSASINTTVVGGQYFLHVTGVGYGDPTDTGYSDYGSLGQYTIDGTVAPTSGSFVSITGTDASKAEGDAGATGFTFTVSRSGDISNAATVDYSIAGGGSNPTDAADFVSAQLSGTVAFLADESSKVITIDIAGDQEVESDETFTVTLENPSTGMDISDGTANGTILNDDTLDTNDFVSIAATSANKSEGDAGSTNFTFVVTRTGYTADATSVSYTISGSGTDPADEFDFITPLSGGTVQFAAGETSQIVTIEVAGDTIVELDEDFTVMLSNAADDTQIVGGAAIGTIQNDDAEAASAEIVVTPTTGLTTSEDARTASFTVALTSLPDADVTVFVSSMDTTEGIVDIGELTFTAANWSEAQTVVVRGVDDTVRDGHVSYTVSVTSQTTGINYQDVDPDDVQLVNQDNEKGGKGNGGGGGGDNNGNGGGKGGPKKGPLPVDDNTDDAGSFSAATVGENVESSGDTDMNEYQVSALEILHALQADRGGVGRNLGARLGTALRSIQERVTDEKDADDVLPSALMPMGEGL